MPRALLWCITIVAAFPLQVSAATQPITQVPVSAAVAALAERLGMDVSRDRGRFAAEIIRRIYSPPQSRRVALDLAAPRSLADGTTLVTVDVPLSAELWSSTARKAMLEPVEAPANRVILASLVRSAVEAKIQHKRIPGLSVVHHSLRLTPQTNFRI